MTTLWRWLISLLVWLSADPAAVDLEHPRAAAAVSAARASMIRETAPPPPAPPAPAACDCGSTCVRGVWRPDSRVEQICRCPCERCKRSRAEGGVKERCPDGRCPTAPKSVLP
jgi:hypothetical protein